MHCNYINYGSNAHRNPKKPLCVLCCSCKHVSDTLSRPSSTRKRLSHSLNHAICTMDYSALSWGRVVLHTHTHSTRATWALSHNMQHKHTMNCKLLNMLTNEVATNEIPTHNFCFAQTEIGQSAGSAKAKHFNAVSCYFL